jgi:hypothetical protein
MTFNTGQAQTAASREMIISTDSEQLCRGTNLRRCLSVAMQRDRNAVDGGQMIVASLMCVSKDSPLLPMNAERPILLTKGEL